MQLNIYRHTVLWCICQALKFKWRALIGTARGADYLEQPPCFAPVVPGRARGAAVGRAVRIFVVRMARWSVRCSPVMLPLSWNEALTTPGVRCSSSMPVARQAYSESGSIVRPFSEIPGLWKNGVANLYNFWKLDGFRNLHRIMLQNFNMFGPIYRYVITKNK